MFFPPRRVTSFYFLELCADDLRQSLFCIHVCFFDAGGQAFFRLVLKSRRRDEIVSQTRYGFSSAMDNGSGVDVAIKNLTPRGFHLLEVKKDFFLTPLLPWKIFPPLHDGFQESIPVFRSPAANILRRAPNLICRRPFVAEGWAFLRHTS